MFLYTNKAFMTDLGSNFSVHLLLVHMILYLLTLQVRSNIHSQIYTVKPVYKGYSKDLENVPFMGSCPLYTG
jgi:membrane-anchored glycerophosphoryl diester phosphodiesterase (GDPDase)